ncbi:hypothetical protein FLAT13_01520 [Flavobacterium salmonis]|uniref:Uncharacterized protein n=1 Tax=Flavobacterium salmonis TaxID=2654844 RepID=A0A6V6YV53_9FLAO|nr:hypothetical protein FLAT13_01520 [Flavobacterium salmonis]
MYYFFERECLGMSYYLLLFLTKSNQFKIKKYKNKYMKNNNLPSSN